MGRSLPVLEIILPVGISFYTFEAINYTVEVYRRRVTAERNPAHLLFFVLFFPHLIAGPIVRARDFLPQIRRSKRWSWARVQLGVEYFLLGLIKKWVVADQLAAFADPVFADADRLRELGQLAGPARLHPPGLLRHLRLLRHGPGHRPHARLQADRSTSTCRTSPPASATTGGAITSRCPPGCATTCSFPLGGSRGGLANLPQLHDHHDPRRTLARGKLELRPLGAAARRLPDRPACVPLLLRGPPASGRSCRSGPGGRGAWP